MWFGQESVEVELKDSRIALPTFIAGKKMKIAIVLSRHAYPEIVGLSNELADLYTVILEILVS